MKNRTEQNRTEQNHYCILNDNSLRFSLSQFFNTFNFLSVLFVFAKALSFASASPRERGFEKSATRSGSRQVIYSNLDCFITFAHAVRLSAMTIKNNFAILNNNVAHAVCLWQAHCVNNSEKSTQGVKTALLYNFLTLIRFNLDNLSMKIKNHCFVINKNYFIFLMELLCR